MIKCFLCLNLFKKGKIQLLFTGIRDLTPDIYCCYSCKEFYFQNKKIIIQSLFIVKAPSGYKDFFEQNI